MAAKPEEVIEMLGEKELLTARTAHAEHRLKMINLAAAFIEEDNSRAVTGAIVDAADEGWWHGHGIACHNVPRLNIVYRLDGEGKTKATPENIREVHAALCFEAAEHAKCYSPFEVTASKFNKADSCFNAEGLTESLWAAFDAACAAAIEADLSTYDNEAYGIGA